MHERLVEATEVRGARVLVVDDDPDVREAVEPPSSSKAIASARRVTAWVR